MRWQLTLQLSAGLALLFGLGYMTAARYVEPPATVQVERTASAEATAIATDIASEWQRLVSSMRTVAISASQGPVLSSLGASVSNAEARPRALKSALEASVAQMGGRGLAVLVDARGTALASSEDDGQKLVKVAAAKDALQGTPSVRFDASPGAGLLIAAAPIPRGEGVGGPAIAGAVVIATPIDASRLALWAGPNAMNSAVVIATEKDIVAGTLGKRTAGFSLANLAPVVTIDRQRYTIAQRDLVDDAGVSARVLGFGHQDYALVDSVTGRVKFLVTALGVLAILLVLSVLLVSPIGVAEEEEDEEQAQAPSPEQTPLPGEVYPALSPRTLEAPAMAHAPLAMPTTKTASSPMMRPAQAAPAVSSQPQLASVPAPPPMQKSKSSEQPISNIPPPKYPQIPERIGRADDAVYAPINEPPTSPSAFDAIAAAAMGSAPPPPRSMLSDDDEMPGQSMFDSDEDLPMPVEHLQLPALKDQRGGASPQQPSAFSRPPAGRPNASPPANAPSSAQPRPTIPVQPAYVQPEPEPKRPMPSKSSPSSMRAPQVPQPAGREYAQSTPVPPAATRPSQSQQFAPAAPPYAATQPMFNPGAAGVGRPKDEALQPRQQHDPWRNPVAASQQETMPVQLPPSDASRGQMPPSQPPLASARPYNAAPQVPQPSQSSSGQARGKETPIAFDEEHYRVVYNEFVGSKARLGEVVDNITFEGFSSKLRSSEKELIDRHGCKAVRFQVLVKDRQVSLRPQLVR